MGWLVMDKESIKQAEEDYAYDMREHENCKIEISEKERARLINSSFCDSQRCY